MSVETEDGFQKELLELFGQEAFEWLQQIHVALDELQQVPEPGRHRVLAQTIKVGITNLGGSAATVNLMDVERWSFSTLPLVEALQDPSVRISPEDFRTLAEQLGRVHEALTRATGVTFKEASPQPSGNERPATIPTTELLALLRGCQTELDASGTISRNLVRAIVAQTEGLVQRGVGQYQIPLIQEFLDRSAEGDHIFLTLVQQQQQPLIAVLRALASGCSEAGEDWSDLHSAVERAAQLWSAAQQVNAVQAMTFFMGLHSFLTIVSQQRVIVSHKIAQAVELRFAQCVKAIEEWVENGRVERLAIHDALLS